MSELVTLLLTLAIMVVGFRIMLRGLFGSSDRRGSRDRGVRQRGPSYLHAFLFSIVLPGVWWAMALLGRFYQRAYIVFTEFLTGVPDWVSYRTSAFKYLGAVLAFLAFNAVILLLCSALLAGSDWAAPPTSVVLTQLVVGLGLGLGARACMRRAP